MKELQYYIEKKLKYGINYDVVKRSLSSKVKLYFLSSLVDFEIVNEIIKGYMIDRSIILNASIIKEKDYDNILTNVLSGCLLLIDNNECFIIETRNYPTRSISESESEKSLKGSHDSFTESILINTALIRRRIKDENFKCELYCIGKKSKTDISINYIEGLISVNLLNKIKRKLKHLDVDSLVLADKALVETMFEQKFQIFPKVRYSERPDIASIHILKGYIVLLVDNSSSCIIIPTTFFELNEQIEEYQLPPLISTFNRIFRFFCLLVGLYLLPLWFIMCIDKHSPNSSILLIDDLNKTQLFGQIISVQVFLSAIRLASFNSTSMLSTSMSLFATIILSNLAVETGLLDAKVVFYGALGSICCYSISNYETSRAVTFWNTLLILSVGFFGKVGFIILSTIMFISMVTINTFDINYLYPFIPFDFNELVHKIFKIPTKKNNKISKIK